MTLLVALTREWTRHGSWDPLLAPISHVCGAAHKAPVSKADFDVVLGDDHSLEYLETQEQVATEGNHNMHTNR